MSIVAVEELQDEIRKCFQSWLDLPATEDEAGSLSDWIGNELSEFLPIGVNITVGPSSVFHHEKSAETVIVINGSTYLKLSCTFFWNDEDFEVEFDVHR